jgi:DNA-binding CsgD family transcriptional regulator/MFS family permease
MREIKVGNKTPADNYRRITIIVFSLFFSWLLAFPFEGRILYTLADYHNISAHQLVFSNIAAHFLGLVFCGFFVKTMQTAKRLMLFSITFCLLVSGVFFLSPTFFWAPALLLASFLAGYSVAAWGYFLKNSTPQGERIKTMADGLIYSNILMILIKMVTVHTSAYTGLALSMLMLATAFLFALKLPQKDVVNGRITSEQHQNGPISINKPLAFLCLFIVVITLNSGLMYQVQVPAFAHLGWLASWYWAIPYIVALYIMRNLPRRTNRTYVLYVAIAMIGFSFIAFKLLDRSWGSYLIVNTLMLGACGVYDLFWWSILGDMLDMDKNPSRILGLGLSANVLGVLLGGITGRAIFYVNGQGPYVTLLALAVVCATLVMLPPLHKSLTAVLKNHIYLTNISEMPEQDQNQLIRDFILMEKLTERESEIIVLLLKGKTYRMIAGELQLSENTVKTHVKNIYSKAGVQSRAELINNMFDVQTLAIRPTKSL